MTKNTRARVILLILILCLIALAAGALFGTQAGARLRDRHELHRIGLLVRVWVGHHAIVAPVIFIAVYMALSLLALPVWWLQVLGGCGFGLVMGIIWTMLGATAGAVLTILLSHWLGGDWVHARAGPRLHKLQRLSESLEHNGLLVVLVTRLVHGIPFGLSNYVFGLVGVTWSDAAIGTFIGGLPVYAFWVALGAHPRLVKDWRFWTVVGCVNVLMLLPVAVRYFRRRKGTPMRRGAR